MRIPRGKPLLMALWIAAAIAVVSRVNGCTTDSLWEPTQPDCPPDSLCHEQGKGVGGQ